MEENQRVKLVVYNRISASGVISILKTPSCAEYIHFGHLNINVKIIWWAERGREEMAGGIGPLIQENLSSIYLSR